jgi:hypothetical protein
LESAEEAHARWGRDVSGFASVDEPGVRRLGERIREQAAAARLEAERGMARRQLLFHLGMQLPPLPPLPGDLPKHVLELRQRLLPPPPKPPPPPLPRPFHGTIDQASRGGDGLGAGETLQTSAAAWSDGEETPEEIGGAKTLRWDNVQTEMQQRRAEHQVKAEMARAAECLRESPAVEGQSDSQGERELEWGWERERGRGPLLQKREGRQSGNRPAAATTAGFGPTSAQAPGGAAVQGLAFNDANDPSASRQSSAGCTEAADEPTAADAEETRHVAWKISGRLAPTTRYPKTQTLDPTKL